MRFFGIMTQLNKQTRLVMVETGQVGDVSNEERKVAKLSGFINSYMIQRKDGFDSFT